MGVVTPGDRRLSAPLCPTTRGDRCHCEHHSHPELHNRNLPEENQTCSSKSHEVFPFFNDVSCSQVRFIFPTSPDNKTSQIDFGMYRVVRLVFFVGMETML